MKILEIEDLAKSAEWAALWERDRFQHASYLPAELAVAATHRQSSYYLPAHIRPAPDEWASRSVLPCSLLAADADGPVLGLALSVEHLDGQAHLSAFGRPLWPVEDLGAARPRRRLAAKLMLRRLTELARENQAAKLHIRDPLVDGNLSVLTELILREGGSAHPFFTQLIDLSASPDEIQADFRNSLRNLIRREHEGFTLAVITNEEVTAHHRDVLHRLHVAMHGRELRPRASWDALLDSVRAGQAFFVFGLADGDYVAGAYFPCSARYCHYAIAANDPSRYGAGLSHLLLWQAIRHSRTLGCRYFEAGDRTYPVQHWYIADKLHAISHFKAGFGSNVATRLDVFSAH